MEQYLRDFMKKAEFPEEAVENLMEGFAEIKKSDSFPLFRRFVTMYEDDEACFSYSEAISACRKIAAKTGVHEYRVILLFFAALTKHCKELYADAGIPEKIWLDSMKDLKYKLIECHDVYGIWGTFVGFWFDRFFDLTRFAFGRLQFEECVQKETYDVNGFPIRPGDWMIQIHIPSAGKLLTEDCIRSLQQAAIFFEDRFPDGVTRFTCHSWLLDDLNDECLPETSGIRQFKKLFTIVAQDVNENRSDLWRIFNKPWEGTTEGLPADNTLRKAYIRKINEGRPNCWGRGIILLKDGQLINR